MIGHYIANFIMLAPKTPREELIKIDTERGFGDAVARLDVNVNPDITGQRVERLFKGWRAVRFVVSRVVIFHAGSTDFVKREILHGA